MGKRCGLGKFIAGAAVGATLGVLFAPKKGSETRKDLQVAFENLVEKVKDIDIKEVKASLEKKVKELQKELSELDKEKVLEIAKEKCEQIKDKADELVKLAIKKGTPVVEKAAADVKAKTVVVLKDIVKRLEEDKKETKKA